MYSFQYKNILRHLALNSFTLVTSSQTRTFMESYLKSLTRFDRHQGSQTIKISRHEVLRSMDKGNNTVEDYERIAPKEMHEGGLP